MSVNITESLHFHDYLCHKIGSEKEVKIRRLTFLAVDTSHIQSLQISSGSQSEGLDLKGSDIDLMYIDPMFVVYESEREAVHGLKESERKAFQRQKGVLIMDTDDKQPCFTRLHLYAIYSKFGKPYRKKIDQHVLNNLFTNAYENNLDKNYFKMLEQHGSKFLLSNERYKQVYFNFFKSEGPLIFSNGKLHGPCISDDTDRYDYAICLKCDKWISQAVPWIDRPRSSWLSPDIISKITTSAHQWVPQFPHIQQKQNNKQQYYRYKYDLSHLLIGLHSDAVAGLLMLASFFYVHENYSTSLDLVHYALSKYTDEKCEHVAVCEINGMINMSLMTPKQESAIDMMKNEKLLTTLKASTIMFPNFPFNSQILPQEIQKDFKIAQTSFHSLTFAYFLRFLCCYHLHDYSECLSAMKQLTLANLITIPTMKSSLNLGFKSSIFIGIATQMMGMTDIAKVFFHQVAYFDKDNFTSAATRLHELRMDW
ncbi:unnamed protein product [Mytilus coruscus]|uniref:Uncharacterized protein n=1 Tax=Mytilus coruscus TaxID=42192 RepID=A0A6J8B035_MYTCO|nr:unnamed protein product [Mytilus coruscus]